MEKWEKKARAAFDRYIEELKAEIEPGSGLAGIERVMRELSPRMLGGVMQSLVDEQAISPPGSAGRVGQKRDKKARSANPVRGD